MLALSGVDHWHFHFKSLRFVEVVKKIESNGHGKDLGLNTYWKWHSDYFKNSAVLSWNNSSSKKKKGTISHFKLKPAPFNPSDIPSRSEWLMQPSEAKSSLSPACILLCTHLTHNLYTGTKKQALPCISAAACLVLQLHTLHRVVRTLYRRQCIASFQQPISKKASDWM